MENIVYKFIPREEIEGNREPIIFVVTPSYLESIVCNVIEEDRELTDIELNRIAHYLFDLGERARTDLDTFLISLMEEVLNSKDSEWTKVDNDFKAKQLLLDDKKLSN